ncbi:MAG: PilZ domain-containing protein, partial [Desulfuromonadaceae bacterium]|nr:PilZ domain-containing protein [Desulfuromonadaceae bacterium]
MSVTPYPILVVSYVDETRTSLTTNLANSGAFPTPCATFCEAENLALNGLYSGLLVDLPSIIKSKGEEKIVAYTLTNFFPTLRVRAMGSLMVPMSMSGSAKQDKSLNDFLSRTCPAFESRKLREFRRHPVCLSTRVRYRGEEIRGFTLNLSWGGVFIVDLQAEKYLIGDKLTVEFIEFECEVSAEVRRIKPWGIKRYAPGIGLCFSYLDESVESAINSVIKTRKEFDRDR